MTDDEALRHILPGTSRWRALTTEDAARCIELHGGRRPVPAPSVPDELHDRDKHIGGDCTED
jgi:hypothetical protein